jgi:hypothetical protein
MRNIIVVMRIRGIRPGAHAAAGLGDGLLDTVSTTNRGQPGLNLTIQS